MAIRSACIPAAGFAIFVFLLFFTGDVLARNGGEESLSPKKVSGFAVIKKNDLAKARSEAIADALRQAINETCSELFPQVVMDGEPCLAEIDKYIYHYRITSEKQNDGNYQADIQVAVDRTLIRKDFLSKKGVRSQKKVTILIRGILKTSDYVRIREFLSNRFQNCGEIIPQQVEWHRAVFVVNACAEVDNIATQLSSAAPFAISVRSVENNVLEIDIPN